MLFSTSSGHLPYLHNIVDFISIVWKSLHGRPILKDLKRKQGDVVSTDISGIILFFKIMQINTSSLLFKQQGLHISLLHILFS